MKNVSYVSWVKTGLSKKVDGAGDVLVTGEKISWQHGGNGDGHGSSSSCKEMILIQK